LRLGGYYAAIHELYSTESWQNLYMSRLSVIATLAAGTKTLRAAANQGPTHHLLKFLRNKGIAAR